MSNGISIITNFDVNSPSPIDSRMVVTSSVAREAIAYKYNGLIVYQSDNSTYYYFKNGTWSVLPNGIYSGSGTLSAATTSISFGTLGNTQSLTSAFNIEYTTILGNGISKLRNSFRRHSNGTNWTGVSFRLQYNNNINDLSYIEFNPFFQNFAGGLAFGTGDASTNPVSEKMRITSDGRFGFNTSNPSDSFQINPMPSINTQPLVMSLRSTTFSAFGHNWFLTSGGTNSIFSTTHSSTLFRFSQTDFSVLFRSQNAPNGSFTPSIRMQNGQDVQILQDFSARDWVSGLATDYRLTDIPDYVNNAEHRYTKIQSFNYNTGVATLSNSINGTRLLISDGANSVDVEVPVSINNLPSSTATQIRYINDILIDRPGIGATAAPAGTIINVRFRHQSTPTFSGTVSSSVNGSQVSSLPFFIEVAINSNQTHSNIVSQYYDSTIFVPRDNIAGNGDRVFNLNARALYIKHNPNDFILGSQPDVITFRKTNTNKWEIININRTDGVRRYRTDVFTFGTVWRMIETSSPQSGIFQSLTGSSVDTSVGASNNFPNFSTSSVVLSNTPEPLAMALERNNKVTIRGIVEISGLTGGSLREVDNPIATIADNDYNRWRIGQINNILYRPAYNLIIPVAVGYANPIDFDVLITNYFTSSLPSNAGEYMGFANNFKEGYMTITTDGNMYLHWKNYYKANLFQHTPSSQFGLLINIMPTTFDAFRSVV